MNQNNQNNQLDFLTKDFCDSIVEKSNGAFMRIERIIEGQEVAIYNYKFARLLMFVTFKAFELRGITFVKNSVGEWERNLLLDKFFNVNQCQVILYEVLLEDGTRFNLNSDEITFRNLDVSLGSDTFGDKLSNIVETKTVSWNEESFKGDEIIEVTNKEDGSVTSPVLFENGVVRFKSKTSFDTEQSKLAQKEYDSFSKDSKNYLKDLLLDGIVPIFEIVSPYNKIVMDYKETELILLQARYEDGRYINEKRLKDIAKTLNLKISFRYNVEEIEEIASKLTLSELEEINKNIKFDSFSEYMGMMREINNFGLLDTETNSLEDFEGISVLDFLMASRKVIQKEEGFVITFKSTKKAKIKHRKYMELHDIPEPNAFASNTLLKTIVHGKIDDVLGSLNNGETKNKLIVLENKVEEYLNSMVNDALALRASYFGEYNENRKNFSIANNKKPTFGIASKIIGVEEYQDKAIELVKKLFIKKISKLKDAQKFIDDILGKDV